MSIPQLPPIPKGQVRPFRVSGTAILNDRADLIAKIEALGISLGVLTLQVRRNSEGTKALAASAIGGEYWPKRWQPNGLGRYCWDLMSSAQQDAARAIANSDKSRLWPWLRDALEDDQLAEVVERLEAAEVDRNREVAGIVEAIADGKEPGADEVQALADALSANSRVMRAMSD